MQSAVRSVTGVRALGTRHAFNGIADSQIAQISTLKLRDISLDSNASTVTVGAGIRYGNLATVLDARGYALHNLASLPHIAVGGACGTVTRGAGMGNGNLATAVRAMEFVAADGSVHTLSREKDGDRFAGAVVGLGAFGVVTHLTLQVHTRYDLTQVVYQDLPFSELEHNFAATTWRRCLVQSRSALCLQCFNSECLLELGIQPHPFQPGLVCFVERRDLPY
jgi:xylitol oxidase